MDIMVITMDTTTATITVITMVTSMDSLMDTMPAAMRVTTTTTTITTVPSILVTENQPPLPTPAPTEEADVLTVTVITEKWLPTRTNPAAAAPLLSAR